MIPIKSHTDLSSLVSQSMNTTKNEDLEKLGLDLKNMDEATRDGKIKRVAIQFEQMLIDELLKSALKDEKEDSDGDEEDAPLMTFAPVNDFKKMLLSQHISDNGGLGYQEIIEQQIRQKYQDIDNAAKVDKENAVTIDLKSIPLVPAKTTTSSSSTQKKANKFFNTVPGVTDFDSLPVIQPVDSNISSNFGWREDPIDGETRFHKGIDFKTPFNTPVKSIMEGEVTFSGWNGGYGNMVEITHADGHITRYGHLSSLKVTKGDKVTTGEVIALSGSTGRSTGPHLHFEVRKDDMAINPVQFFKEKSINVLAKKSEIRDVST